MAQPIVTKLLLTGPRYLALLTIDCGSVALKLYMLSSVFGWQSHSFFGSWPLWRPHAHRAPLYDGRRIAARGGGLPHDRVRDPQSRRLGGVRAEGRGGPGRLVAGRLRCPCPEILPQGRHRTRAQAGARGRTCRSGCGGVRRTRRPKRAPTLQTTSRARASARPRRCFTASPAPGPIGAGRPATSTANRMPAPSMTSSSPCWRSRSRRPTRRSGSTPGCIGPMASTARPRVTTTSISSRAR